MKNSKLNPFSSLRGAKRSKHRGNLRIIATPNTTFSKRHPEACPPYIYYGRRATAEGSAQLINLADSSLSLRMTVPHFEFLIREA